MNLRVLKSQPAATALPDDDAARLADMFRLLGDASRLRILSACTGAPASVGAIALATGLSISLVSHHLRLLKAARLVRGQRQGKQVFYVLADDHIRCTIADMVDHVREPGDGAEEED